MDLLASLTIDAIQWLQRAFGDGDGLDKDAFVRAIYTALRGGGAKGLGGAPPSSSPSGRVVGGYVNTTTSATAMRSHANHNAPTMDAADADDDLSSDDDGEGEGVASSSAAAANARYGTPLFTSSAKKWTRQALTSLFYEIDYDNNGSVSWSEFTSFVIACGDPTAGDGDGGMPLSTASTAWGKGGGGGSGGTEAIRRGGGGGGTGEGDRRAQLLATNAAEEGSVISAERIGLRLRSEPPIFPEQTSQLNKLIYLSEANKFIASTASRVTIHDASNEGNGYVGRARVCGDLLDAAYHPSSSSLITSSSRGLVEVFDATRGLALHRTFTTLCPINCFSPLVGGANTLFCGDTNGVVTAMDATKCSPLASIDVQVGQYAATANTATHGTSSSTIPRPPPGGIGRNSTFVSPSSSSSPRPPLLLSAAYGGLGSNSNILRVGDTLVSSDLLSGLSPQQQAEALLLATSGGGSAEGQSNGNASGGGSAIGGASSSSSSSVTGVRSCPLKAVARFTMAHHKDTVSSLQYVGVGKYSLLGTLLTASMDNTMTLCDVGGGGGGGGGGSSSRILFTLPSAHTKYIKGLAVNTHRSLVLTYGGDTFAGVTTLGPQHHKPLRLEDAAVPHPSRLVGIVSADRDDVITADASGMLKLWDLRMMRCVQTCIIPQVLDATYANSATTNMIINTATTAFSGNVGGSTAPMLGGAAMVKIIPKRLMSAGISYNPHTQQLFALGPSVTVFDRQQRQISTTTHREPIVAMAFNPFTFSVITCTPTDVAVWSVMTGVCTVKYTNIALGASQHGAITCMCVDHHQEGRRVLVGTSTGYVVSIVLVSGTVMWSYRCVDTRVVPPEFRRISLCDAAADHNIIVGLGAGCLKAFRETFLQEPSRLLYVIPALEPIFGVVGEDDTNNGAMEADDDGGANGDSGSGVFEGSGLGHTTAMGKTVAFSLSTKGATTANAAAAAIAGVGMSSGGFDINSTMLMSATVGTVGGGGGGSMSPTHMPSPPRGAKAEGILSSGAGRHANTSSAGGGGKGTSPQRPPTATATAAATTSMKKKSLAEQRYDAAMALLQPDLLTASAVSHTAALVVCAMGLDASLVILSTATRRCHVRPCDPRTYTSKDGTSTLDLQGAEEERRRNRIRSRNAAAAASSPSTAATASAHALPLPSEVSEILSICFITEHPWDVVDTNTESPSSFGGALTLFATGDVLGCVNVYSCRAHDPHSELTTAWLITLHTTNNVPCNSLGCTQSRFLCAGTESNAVVSWDVAPLVAAALLFDLGEDNAVIVNGATVGTNLKGVAALNRKSSRGAAMLLADSPSSGSNHPSSPTKRGGSAAAGNKKGLRSGSASNSNSIATNASMSASNNPSVPSFSSSLRKNASFRVSKQKKKAMRRHEDDAAFGLITSIVGDGEGEQRMPKRSATGLNASDDDHDAHQDHSDGASSSSSDDDEDGGMSSAFPTSRLRLERERLEEGMARVRAAISQGGALFAAMFTRMLPPLPGNSSAAPGGAGAASPPLSPANASDGANTRKTSVLGDVLLQHSSNPPFSSSVGDAPPSANANLVASPPPLMTVAATLGGVSPSSPFLAGSSRVERHQRAAMGGDAPPSPSSPAHGGGGGENAPTSPTRARGGLAHIASLRKGLLLGAAQKPALPSRLAVTHVLGLPMTGGNAVSTSDEDVVRGEAKAFVGLEASFHTAQQQQPLGTGGGHPLSLEFSTPFAPTPPSNPRHGDGHSGDGSPSSAFRQLLAFATTPISSPLQQAVIKKPIRIQRGTFDVANLCSEDSTAPIAHCVPLGASGLVAVCTGGVEPTAVLVAADGRIVGPLCASRQEDHTAPSLASAPSSSAAAKDAPPKDAPSSSSPPPSLLTAPTLPPYVFGSLMEESHGAIKKLAANGAVTNAATNAAYKAYAELAWGGTAPSTFSTAHPPPISSSSFAALYPSLSFLAEAVWTNANAANSSNRGSIANANNGASVMGLGGSFFLASSSFAAAGGGPPLSPRQSSAANTSVTTTHHHPYHSSNQQQQQYGPLYGCIADIDMRRLKDLAHRSRAAARKEAALRRKQQKRDTISGSLSAIVQPTSTSTMCRTSKERHLQRKKEAALLLRVGANNSTSGGGSSAAKGAANSEAALVSATVPPIVMDLLEKDAFLKGKRSAIAAQQNRRRNRNKRRLSMSEASFSMGRNSILGGGGGDSMGAFDLTSSSEDDANNTSFGDGRRRTRKSIAAALYGGGGDESIGSSTTPRVQFKRRMTTRFATSGSLIAPMSPHSEGGGGGSTPPAEDGDNNDDEGGGGQQAKAAMMQRNRSVDVSAARRRALSMSTANPIHAISGGMGGGGAAAGNNQFSGIVSGARGSVFAFSGTNFMNSTANSAHNTLFDLHQQKQMRHNAVLMDGDDEEDGDDDGTEYKNRRHHNQHRAGSKKVGGGGSMLWKGGSDIPKRGANLGASGHLAGIGGGSSMMGGGGGTSFSSPSSSPYFPSIPQGNPNSSSPFTGTLRVAPEAMLMATTAASTTASAAGGRQGNGRGDTNGSQSARLPSIRGASPSSSSTAKETGVRRRSSSNGAKSTTAFHRHLKRKTGAHGGLIPSSVSPSAAAGAAEEASLYAPKSPMARALADLPQDMRDALRRIHNKGDKSVSPRVQVIGGGGGAAAGGSPASASPALSGASGMNTSGGSAPHNPAGGGGGSTPSSSPLLRMGTRTVSVPSTAVPPSAFTPSNNSSPPATSTCVSSGIPQPPPPRPSPRRGGGGVGFGVPSQTAPRTDGCTTTMGGGGGSGGFTGTPPLILTPRGATDNASLSLSQSYSSAATGGLSASAALAPLPLRGPNAAVHGPPIPPSITMSKGAVEAVVARLSQPIDHSNTTTPRRSARDSPRRNPNFIPAPMPPPSLAAAALGGGAAAEVSVRSRR